MPKLPKSSQKLKRFIDLSDEEQQDVIASIKSNDFQQFLRIIQKLSSLHELVKVISKNIDLEVVPKIDDLTHVEGNFGRDQGRHYTEQELKHLFTLIREQEVFSDPNVVREVPSYKFEASTLSFMGKVIQIKPNSNQDMICRVVFKNKTTMKKEWEWGDLLHEYGESAENFTVRKIYTAVRGINRNVLKITGVNDFFLTKPWHLVRLNPKYIPQ